MEVKHNVREGFVTAIVDHGVTGYLKEIPYFRIKLMKGKIPRKHSMHAKTAASVLLKLFISGNE